MPNATATNKPVEQELKVDEQGFVTPAKAISLPGLSLAIWVATLVLYRILVIMQLCPAYTAFCFFTSLGLSVGGAMFTVKKLKTQVTASSKLFLVLMNTFVIYTSANGIQAGNSFLYKSEPGEVCQKASLIPLLPAAPWLPDKESKEKIQAQADSIKRLTDSLATLNKKYNDDVSLAQSSGATVTTLLNRVDSIQNLLQLAQTKNQLWDSLKRRWALAPDRSLDTLLLNFRKKDIPMPRSGKWFVAFLSDSTAGQGFYKQLLEQ